MIFTSQAACFCITAISSRYSPSHFAYALTIISFLRNGRLHSAIVLSVDGVHSESDTYERIGEGQEGECNSVFDRSGNNAVDKCGRNVGACAVVDYDVVAIVLDGTNAVFYRLSSRRSALRECNAIVFDMSDFKSVQQFVAVRGVYRNDNFRHLLECQKRFD